MKWHSNQVAFIFHNFYGELVRDVNELGLFFVDEYLIMCREIANEFLPNSLFKIDSVDKMNVAGWVIKVRLSALLSGKCFGTDLRSNTGTAMECKPLTTFII